MSAGDLRLSVIGEGPRRQVWAFRDDHPVFSLCPRFNPRRRAAAVRCDDQPDSELVAFLLAHFDDIVDAGWSPTTWILADCPACGAEPFHPCRDRRRPGRWMRGVHRERDA